MIEFGLTMGILFILLLSLFEWSQIFIKHYKASTICREAAVAAHHDCKNAEGAGVEQCLGIIRTEMLEKASKTFPQFSTRGDIVLTFYGALTGQVGGTYTSRISGVDPNLITDLQTVVVSELFYDNPLATGMERLFSFVMPRLIYKSTII